MNPHAPRSTYRLQFHKGFTFADAEATLPYLKRLGIGHIYASPLLDAKPGSAHGYDVRAHDRANPELGGDAAFEAFAARLHAEGFGLLLDIVPNHMSVACDNAWWLDVLEHGESSPFAGHFDIAWNDHPREQLRGKVLLPILGEPYGAALEAGRFRPVYEQGKFALMFYDTRLPIDPRSYDVPLASVLDALCAGSPEALELQSIVKAIRHLPPRHATDEGSVLEARAESAVIQRRMKALCEDHPDVCRRVDAELARLAGEPGRSESYAPLEAWLDAQAYRPSFWRVASDEINYRRFFDVNDLAAVSVERPEVFDASHAKLLDWYGRGLVDGFRIDHPDGLFDPKGYLVRLQAAMTARRPAAPGYIAVEKILGTNEALDESWPVAGTTGYEFLNVVNGLFVDPSAEAAFDAGYEPLRGADRDHFDEMVYQKKFLILQTSLSSELHVLAHQLDRLAQMDRGSRDYTLNGLRHALREVIACFPVYRSYIDGSVDDFSRKVVLQAVRRARRRNPVLGSRVFDFIRDSLMLRDPSSGPASEEYRAAQIRFAGKFQQVTSPVMAKGFEDTAMYVYNRLASLCEVGGEPHRFGVPPRKVHQFLAERQAKYPGALSCLSTHDTKRGEDVRARLNVLSEMPERWFGCVRRWMEQNRPHRVAIDDDHDAPDPNEEYLLYQTLVGSWPAGGLPDAAARAAYSERIQEYMAKATHEAKVNTSWINPDPAYDAALAQFIGALLDPAKSAEFLASLAELAEEVGAFGAVNSLAQTLVRLTAPGVPDTYQGTETLTYTLVDPDNRRPVDYAANARLLESAGGAAKLFVTAQALRLRSAHPELFADGAYRPCDVTGEGTDHVFAFERELRAECVAVAVPRLPAKRFGSPAAVGDAGKYADTTVGMSPGAWRDVLTGVRTDVPAGGIAASQLFAGFAVALLVRENVGG